MRRVAMTQAVTKHLRAWFHQNKKMMSIGLQDMLPILDEPWANQRRRSVTII